MRILERFYFLFKPFIAIFFLDNLVAGAAIALVTLLVPSVALLGFSAVVGTILMANFLQIKETYLKEGFYLYNSLLVGMGIGYFFGISILSFFLSLFFGVLTFVTTFGFNYIFSKLKLPILSLPFALVSLLFYLASYKYSMLYSNILELPMLGLDPSFGEYIDEFLRSFGTIIFMPYTLIGVLLFGIVLLFSRILAILAVVGFLVGVLAHSYLTGIESPASFYNFNYILIAMALGGVFLVPHPKSYAIAMIGVVLSVFVIDATEVFFYSYHLPLYTIPFNTIVILFLLLLSAISFRYYNFAPQSTPEKSLEHFLSDRYRFKSDQIQIGLPFMGQWSVYQGFDGKWTHKGHLRYAYDFVKKVDGRLFAGEGNHLEDYYSFGQSVVAPIDGEVVATREDLADNIIGEIDRKDVWGNFVLIRSQLGYYILIAHLLQGSVKVKVGEFVQKDQIIAKCGNSGYSPLPHIHIQVQSSPVLGSPTLPFLFDTYCTKKQIHYYDLPKEGEEIENLPIDPIKKMRVDFVLDDRFCYEIEGKDVWIEVKMNSNGEFHFTDGKNRLYFYTYAKSFYFYRYEGGDSILKELFLVAPRVPLVSKEGAFDEILPPSLEKHGPFFYLMLSFYHKLFSKRVRYESLPDGIRSSFGEVRFDPHSRGFASIKSAKLNAKLKDCDD